MESRGCPVATRFEDSARNTELSTIMSVDKRAIEVAAGLSVVVGALIEMHGVTSRRWQIARAGSALAGAIAIAAVRYKEDGKALLDGSS